MKQLFEATQIRNMKMRNRFVRSATWEGMAGADGEVTPQLTERMAELAGGGVGLIITGQAFISSGGRAAPWQLGIHDDSLLPGLRQMTDAVHQAGGAIIPQIAHAGALGFGAPPLVASSFVELQKPDAREIGPADIKALTELFAAAADRAKRAGFDGVQLHAAHGYLLSQFLSPYYNRRQDEYGGSVENRSRIHAEIIAAVRKAVGDDFAIIVKLNGKDDIENGLMPDDSLKAGLIMQQAGADAIELSGGMINAKSAPSRTSIKTEADEAYFQHEARALSSLLEIPVMLVGGIRSYSVAESVIRSGTADYVSMSRPLIKEPGLIRRWEAGDYVKSKCLSDNKCFKSGLSGSGIACDVNTP